MTDMLVFDLETAGTKTFGRFCNPLDSRHFPVMIGYQSIQSKHALYKYNQTGLPETELLEVILHSNKLTGQNIKFDLMWLWKYPRFQDHLIKLLSQENSYIIYDTMLAAYLLCGQQTTVKISLDALAAQYDGTQKDDDVGAMFAAGITADNVPEEILVPYGLEDVKNTALIARKQMREIEKNNQSAIIKTYMRHLLAVTEIEYNGMYVNKPQGFIDMKPLEEQEKILGDKLTNMVPNWPSNLQFNPASTQHIACVLFGGEQKTIIDQVQEIFYKTGPRAGQHKTKKAIELVTIAGFGIIPPVGSKNRASYSTDEKKVLEPLMRTKMLSNEAREFIETLLEYRGIIKLLGTYYYREEISPTGKIKEVGMLRCIMPDGCVHSEYTTHYTRTGRLSSRGPNMQNIAPQVLNLFESRFEDGWILEFDMHQLEIVIQAWLTQCPKMMEDLVNGVDFHRLRLGYALDMSYEDVINVPGYKDKRKKIAKPISFEKAYGAHPTTVAVRHEIPLETVEKVYAKEDEDYPEIRQFYENIMEELAFTRRPTNRPLRVRNKKNNTVLLMDGETVAEASWRSPTGKIYMFEEKAVLTKNNTVWRYWPMTEIQNYPIQGMASDIMAVVVAEVFKYLKLNHPESAKLVNEVHDSVIIDCQPHVKDLLKEKVSSIMKNVPYYMNKYFNLNFNVQLDVDVSEGRTWAECKQED